jgi:hypothetical protein
MKKKICLALVLCIVVTMLCSCSSSSYEKAVTSNTTMFSAGYFTVLKEWDGGIDCPLERIVYANDTGVMYYTFIYGHSGGITPLYNADGTLQIYEGD